MQKDIKNKFPKKHQKYIKDAYKEYDRYCVVLEFEDGFARSIGDFTLSDIKYYVKQCVEVDRNTQL